MNKPCPFCGSTQEPTVMIGTTHRWIIAVCPDCEARGPEVRRELMKQSPTAQDKSIALGAWNQRAVE